MNTKGRTNSEEYVDPYLFTTGFFESREQYDRLSDVVGQAARKMQANRIKREKATKKHK